MYIVHISHYSDCHVFETLSYVMDTFFLNKHLRNSKYTSTLRQLCYTVKKNNFIKLVIP